MLVSSLERLAQFCLRYTQQARQEHQLAEQEAFGMRPYAQPGTVVDTGVRHQVSTVSHKHLALTHKWLKQLSLTCCTAPIGCGATGSTAPVQLKGLLGVASLHHAHELTRLAWCLLSKMSGAVSVSQ